MEEDALLIIREGGVQTTDIDTHNGVARRKVGESAVYGVAFDVVEIRLQIGIGVEVFGIEEATLRSAGVLAGMVVVVTEVQIVDVDEPVVVLVVEQ